MKLEDIKPAHCHALATQLLGEVRALREEMGRAEDARPGLEVVGAEPREVYFEALGAWRKAVRLAGEVGVSEGRVAPPSPGTRDLRPGHCLALITAVRTVVGDIRAKLGITTPVAEHAAEMQRQPSDVLVTLVRVNRELSRALERPFTPSDVYGVVALAAAHAELLGGKAPVAELERGRRPADCYDRLSACLTKATSLITKKGGAALAARGSLPDAQPGDVYDLALLVLGELVHLHALTTGATSPLAYEPALVGHRLPAHVHQLARTLEAQLAAIG